MPTTADNIIYISSGASEIDHGIYCLNACSLVNGTSELTTNFSLITTSQYDFLLTFRFISPTHNFRHASITTNTNVVFI
jgi:hypothetical protein